MIQFPILGEQDTFTDENGPHKTGETVNIPLRPGTAALSGPFTVIHRWLTHHIPNLKLPVDLESLPAEDRNSLFSKIIVEVEGGEKIKLSDILKPLIHTPNWKTLNPAEFQLPYHLLNLPIKNMFVEVRYAVELTKDSYTPLDVNFQFSASAIKPDCYAHR